ncbi:MAG: radical SAM protein [Actinomycetota bacterium]|nr:radical SAM protein [Actinomycetota bacterium]
MEKEYRYHSADYVIENIERLIADYKIEALYFHDNNFLYSKSHVENICMKIIKKNLHKRIKWCIQGSSSFVNEDMLRILSEAGCIKIELGIESIKESSLKSMNKSSTLSVNERALKLCRKYNISTHAYFMTGFEGENISDLDQTIAWIKKHKSGYFFTPSPKNLSRYRPL